MREKKESKKSKAPKYEKPILKKLGSLRQITFLSA